jgi:hypothetical protein
VDSEQVMERFFRIERYLDWAALVGRSAQRVPPALRQCLDELEQRSGELKHLVAPSYDPAALTAWVDALKQLGDRAAEASEAAQDLDRDLRNAIEVAQNEIAHLRRQLH